MRLFALLKLRGRVRLDPNGTLLGKRHRFEIEWTALIELPNGDQEYKKTRTRFYTPAYEAWEAKYLPERQVEAVAAR